MIGTIANIIRGEGTLSAVRRTSERAGEAVEYAASRAASLFAGRSDAEIVNVSWQGISPRTGGGAVLLAARLRAESALRNVALLHPGGLRLSVPFSHTRWIDISRFAAAVREAVSITGAKAVHIDGTSGIPFDAVVQLIESSLAVVISVHDFSLFCARPHLLEQPADLFCGYSHDLDRCERCLRQTWDVRKDEQAKRRELARQILASATGVIFPSQFLLEQHRQLFSLPQFRAAVIEPAGPATAPDRRAGVPATGVAFAGSVKRHKGGHLLPEIAAMLGSRGLALHVFGGGDVDLLQALRRQSNAIIHGYYRSGELPSLLARHGIGLVMIPSIWPETYCMALSEAWLAGAAVAAFDLGAPADRIRTGGGGWLTPLESGAAGLVAIVDRWRSGDAVHMPSSMPSATNAAQARQLPHQPTRNR